MKEWTTPWYTTQARVLCPGGLQRLRAKWDIPDDARFRFVYTAEDPGEPRMELAEVGSTFASLGQIEVCAPNSWFWDARHAVGVPYGGILYCWIEIQT